jgi:hypothetical protein
VEGSSAASRQSSPTVTVAAERQFRLDAVPDRADAKLLQADHLCPGERHLPEIGERRSPPEVERLAQQARRARLVAAGEGAAPLRGEPLEPVHVDLVRLDREPVAGRVQLDRRAGPVLVTQEVAEAGDLGLERVAGVGRRVPAIQPVDQPRHRDHLARIQEQQGEQRAEAGPADGDLPPVGAAHLRRTEDAVSHAWIMAPDHRRPGVEAVVS